MITQQNTNAEDFTFEEDTPQTPQQATSEFVPPTQVTTAVERPTEEAKPLIEEKKEKRLFTRNDIVRAIPINIILPRLLPDFEPFGFKFRLKLSKQAEEQRQVYLALSAVEMTEQMSSQSLNEVCDLLAELPTGFGDLKDTGQGPGPSFRNYVETTTDPDMKSLLEMIVDAADSVYWNTVAPREFRG